MHVSLVEKSFFISGIASTKRLLPMLLSGIWIGVFMNCGSSSVEGSLDEGLEFSF